MLRDVWCEYRIFSVRPAGIRGQVLRLCASCSMVKQAGAFLYLCWGRPILSLSRGAGGRRHSGVLTHRPAVGVVEGGRKFPRYLTRHGHALIYMLWQTSPVKFKLASPQNIRNTKGTLEDHPAGEKQSRAVQKASDSRLNWLLFG